MMVENVEDVKGAERSADLADGAELEERVVEVYPSNLALRLLRQTLPGKRPTRSGSTGARRRCAWNNRKESPNPLSDW